MRRIRAIGLMLLSLCVLVVTHVQAQTAEWYQHPEGAYRMKLSVGWKLLPPNLERGVDIIAINESSEEMLICDRKSTNLIGLTPEQSLATFELSLKQSATRQQLSRTTIGGMPAVLASNYDPTKQIASYTLIVLYKQHSYQLGAAVSSKVVLPTPPEVVRDSWASIVWQGTPADTPTPDREAYGHSSEQEVSVIQLFTPTAEKFPDDVLWQEPASPNQSINLPAFSIDANSLAWSANKLQPGSRAVLSAAQEAMRLLYGPMNGKQAYQFEAKWAPFYNQSTPECEAQIRAMTPLLGQMVVARSGFAQSARSFFRLLVQANIARVSGNTREAAEALRLCRYAQTMMIGYQACIETLCRQLELPGDLQNPTKAQQGQHDRFVTEWKALNNLAGLPEPVTDRQQMVIASELHKEYLNNLSQCFTEARLEQTTKVMLKGNVQPESLRRLLWTDTLQRLADDELSRVETSLPVHRRSLMDDLNAQMLMNWGREEALKVQRVMGLLQTASALQLQIPEDQLGDVEAEWASHINAKLLVARNTTPISDWVQELASKSTGYWSSHGNLPSASARLAGIERLRQNALAEPTGIQLGLSDVPVSGLGSAGARCWGADSPALAALEGAQGYHAGGVVNLAREVMSWSQLLCRGAQSAIDNWNALPENEPGLKRASDLLAQSKCFEFAKLYAGASADLAHDIEPDLARFEADLQQGKRLAEAYIQAGQRLDTSAQLDPASKELPALYSTAQQLAASVIVNTPAKYYLSQLSIGAQQSLTQHMTTMNQAIYAQMVQTLAKQGYNASAIRLSPSEVCGAESIDCITADAVSAFQRGKEMVGLYQLLQDARSAYYQAYESVSRYGGQHGCSAKSDSLSPMALPFAAALSTNLVKLQPTNGQPLPLLLLGQEEMGQSVDTASFKMPVSSDTGITNTQEQCRQLNRDIRLKLIPWLDAQTGSKPEIQQTASYFRKLQMVLERASRKLPNPGLLSLATQELDRLTGGVSVEQLAVYLAPVLDKLSGNR